MWKPTKYTPPYDPLRGLPDSPVTLRPEQAEALRCILERGELHAMYGETAEEIADEYRMHRWLRAEVLIDPHDRVTRKGTASLHLFDHPPTQMVRFEGRAPIEEDVVEDEEELVHDSRVVVALADDEKISVRITQSPTLEWVAEALVGSYGTKRRRRMRTRGDNKAIVLQALIKKASEFREQSYVATFS